MIFRPLHPGRILRQAFNGMPVSEAAAHLGVTRAALSRILNERAGISPDMALRLSEALGTSPEVWIGMQSQYDLWRAAKKRRKKIARLGAA